MQKISTYLYPNRIELLADLAGFTVEYTNVYQRNIKIYKGVDNVIQFDIKNADQKRLDLVTSPSISGISMNVMDASGKALPNSPYTVDPVGSTLKGIASVTIPADDLASVTHQNLQYSITASDAIGNTIALYTDSRFSAIGTIEIVGSAVPVTRDSQVVTSFYKDLQFGTTQIEYFHSSAIPLRFYEAIPTTVANVDFRFNSFAGTVLVEATKDASISSESFTLRGTVLETFAVVTSTASTIKTYSAIGDYTYIRISYTNATNNTGTITKVTVS
jgi:hypothetical protein